MLFLIYFFVPSLFISKNKIKNYKKYKKKIILKMKNKKKIIIKGKKIKFNFKNLKMQAKLNKNENIRKKK